MGKFGSRRRRKRAAQQEIERLKEENENLKQSKSSVVFVYNVVNTFEKQNRCNELRKMDTLLKEHEKRRVLSNEEILKTYEKKPPLNKVSEILNNLLKECENT